MATSADPGVALLSIHPRYARAIMAGAKRVEFRKQRFARPVSHIVIYETAPTARIVGAIAVGGCDVASPAELWQRYGDVGAIESEDFDGYYCGRETGVAIQLEGAPVPLDLPLSAVGQARPPQSFAYLQSDVLPRLALGRGPSVPATLPAVIELPRKVMGALSRLVRRTVDAVG